MTYLENMRENDYVTPTRIHKMIPTAIAFEITSSDKSNLTPLE